MSEQISKEDQNRVNNCEYYLKTKQTMKNAEVYKDLAIGEVYFIKRKGYNGEEEYVTGGWNNDPAKYMVFHKDDGFVFVKRIIANGKMGKEVTCLTTEYDVGHYWLEADPDYVNSILLENEESYDPLAASKKLASDKNKARRRNKKLQINYKTEQEAFDYIKTLKVGDTIYDTISAYGSGLLTWDIEDITHRPVDSKNIDPHSWRSNPDKEHRAHGFKEIYVIHLKRRETKSPKERRWEDEKKDVTFRDFKGGYRSYYHTKPYTPSDV